eukprot:766210-Hanusia_phi.AAC.3
MYGQLGKQTHRARDRSDGGYSFQQVKKFLKRFKVADLCACKEIDSGLKRRWSEMGGMYLGMSVPKGYFDKLQFRILALNISSGPQLFRARCSKHLEDFVNIKFGACVPMNIYLLMAVRLQVFNGKELRRPADLLELRHHRQVSRSAAVKRICWRPPPAVASSTTSSSVTLKSS